MIIPANVTGDLSSLAGGGRGGGGGSVGEAIKRKKT